jgi:hypothetical protein
LIHRNRESGWSAESGPIADLCGGFFYTELPTEKWGTKTTAFGVVTNPVCIHSGVTLAVKPRSQEMDTMMTFSTS